MGRPLMKIDVLSFSNFRCLLGDAVVDMNNPGCAWYASEDRRVAAKLFIDPGTERWKHSTYHLFRCEWVCHDSAGFEHFDAAVKSLNAALSELTLQSVRIVDIQPVHLAQRDRRKRSAINREAAEVGEFPPKRAK
jgi:hypothetical protein